MQLIIASYQDFGSSSIESSPAKSNDNDNKECGLLDASASRPSFAVTKAVTCNEGQSLLDASVSSQAEAEAVVPADKSCCSLDDQSEDQVAAEDSCSLDQSTQAMTPEGCSLGESLQVHAIEAHSDPTANTAHLDPTANIGTRTRNRTRQTSAVAWRDEEDLPSTEKKAAVCTASGGRKYCVLYENNSSKKWDGKKVMIDGETLESLYSIEDLVLGKSVVIPWPGRGGKVEDWKGILVDPTGWYKI